MSTNDPEAPNGATAPQAITSGAQTFAVRVVREGMVGEVCGLDLSEPMSGLQGQIERVLAAHPVLVFRDQDLTEDQLKTFATQFGPLTSFSGRFNADTDRDAQSQVFDVSNVDAEGSAFSENSPRRAFIEAARLWHSDSTYNPVPDSYSMLYGRKVTARGGETEFADMRAAYDALPVARRERIGGLRGLHSTDATLRRAGYAEAFDLGFAPSAAHPIVRRHPISGRMALFIGAHMCGVEGMEPSEFEALLEALIGHSSAPRFVYSHTWRQGDVVMWDNRSVMHRGRPYDLNSEVRDLRQVRVTERDYQPLQLPA